MANNKAKEWLDWLARWLPATSYQKFGVENGIAVGYWTEGNKKGHRKRGAWLVGSLSLLTKAFYALWGSLGRWLFEFLWNWQYDIDHWGFTARCSARTATGTGTESMWREDWGHCQDWQQPCQHSPQPPAIQDICYCTSFFLVSNHCSFIWPVIIRTRLAAVMFVFPLLLCPWIKEFLFYWLTTG